MPLDTARTKSSFKTNNVKRPGPARPCVWPQLRIMSEAMPSDPPLSVEEAQTRIANGIALLPCESVTLDQALGRVLGQSVTVTRDNPPFANSAMDGYAVRADTCAVGTRLPVTATIGAGCISNKPLAPHTAARIFTGAPLPAGADSVVMQEHTERDGDTVALLTEVAPGQHVRPQGDDMRRGERLLDAGTILRAGDIGALASQGIGAVAVRRRPRVAILPTGDELTMVGDTCPPGKIYDANSHLLAAQVKAAGGTPMAWPTLPDQAPALMQGFLMASQSADMVLTTGGVSVGDYDLVRACLQDIGSIDFWRVAIKPGKPLAYGHIEQTPLFGLPGNPVSCFVCFALFVRPALYAMQGQTHSARTQGRANLSAPLAVHSQRREFVRARLHSDDTGTVWVTPLPHQGSHHMRSLLGADCLLDIPAMSCTLEQGQTVQTLLLDPVAM